MIKHLRLLLAAIALLPVNFVFAQNTVLALDQTLNRLQKQAADYPFEKVYLHLDKPYYGVGDTIWFKGYTVIGAGHNLSGRSNVLNVELIDGQNRVKRSIKLPLISGLTYGDFALADTLDEGNYRIRAYTNWMRNAGPEYFFDKTITIVNAVSNKVFTKSSYTYTLSNGQQSVNAVINYTNLEGSPYANKEVKYEVQLDPQKVGKGKGITDEKGDLHLTFTHPTPNVLSTGEIITSIQLDNQKAVTKTIAIKATTAKVNVQFFPESGGLVNGIASKIAFKAVSADGLGADVKGTITDGQGNEVTTFSSTHLGMGMLWLAPETGKSYKAHVSYADGSMEIIDLPKATDKGYVMAIRTDSANVIVKITGDETQDGMVTLVAQSGGKVYLQGKGKPGKKSFTAIIPKIKLPSGIIQFTLFSDSGEPLNERLVFVQNPDQLKLKVSTEKTTYAPRQKVKINLEARNEDGQPVLGNFSVAVIDEAKVPVDENTESTILSNILLTSDIKGYIEQPNYYLAHPDEKTAADLDVLMLTQGYHRFEWKQIINNVTPNVVYEPEKELTISGTVKTLDGKPLPNGKVSLISNSGSFFIIDTVADKNGRFVFKLDFKDSSKFNLKAASVNKDNVLIELDKAPSLVSANKNAGDIQVSINNGMETYLQNSKKQHDEELKYGIGDHSKILKEVKVSTKRPKTEKELRIEKAVEFSANLNGKGNADQIFTAEDFEGKGCAKIADCLAGRILGVTFDINGVPYSTRGNNSFRGRTPMMIVLDGIVSQSSIINVDDISSIEVLRTIGNTAIYGVRASGGVLVITTKHGAGFVADNKNEAGVIWPQGYYKAREFYSPQYDNPKTNTQVADLRTTIFWKPIIEMDNNGNASFEYFNAGSKGSYRVVVEGLDYSGNLGRQVYRYKVE